MFAHIFNGNCEKNKYYSKPQQLHLPKNVSNFTRESIESYTVQQT